MPRFTVDTHLFRELGELLVGRDSTALIELVKNAYDADATEVVVSGIDLASPRNGRIVVRDDGTGMTKEQFEAGFLRVASRLKEQGTRRSSTFGRRYTGAKGIGRLAAHKLARLLEVTSVTGSAGEGGHCSILHAAIDWDAVERGDTLDSLPSDAIVMEAVGAKRGARTGTTVELSRLRRAWSTTERGRFLGEVQSFSAPDVLLSPLPDSLVPAPLLFTTPVVRDAAADTRGGFEVRLEGDLEGGDSYWDVLSHAAAWVIEIRAHDNGRVDYCVSPTRRTLREVPHARPYHASCPHPAPTMGPLFDARIVVRVGQSGLKTPDQRAWGSKASGVRVYLEGFRVLPYGEPSDDWLGIDAQYTRRARSLPLLADWDGDMPLPEDDPNAPLVVVPSNNYLGGVFLTQERATGLRALVNREGFVPEGPFLTLVDLVRKGIDVCTRVRAATKLHEREARRVRRLGGSERSAAGAVWPGPARHLRQAVAAVEARLQEVSALVESGRPDRAGIALDEARNGMSRVCATLDELISEQALYRVLASVGTQMAAFVHEVNLLVLQAATVDNGLGETTNGRAVPPEVQRPLSAVQAAASDLRRSLERQAAYLTDVTAIDARRRRSRQRVAKAFEAASNLVLHQAERRGVRLENDLDPSLRTPPMFPAEVVAVLANLLTNAVKAAGRDGVIRASGSGEGSAGVQVRVENTGVAVDLGEAERWFRPFESTTVDVDPSLGQGMGLGLPITRAVLREYDADVRFVEPSEGFATAVEITFRH